MKTTATNRKIRVLLKAMREQSLEPRPEFQRRLVWNSRHQREFLRTVLEEYPFPEVYIAAGSVDPDTGEGKEMLVDGQQRLTTLHQYFTGSPDLRLGDLKAYSELEDEEKLAFLEYEVVVRDLGKKNIEEIKEIFTRINSTKYALNAMELHNARFEGEFKEFGEEIARHTFFEENRVFRTTEIRRMGDIRFGLLVAATVMSTYFNRDDEIESYLENYNDQFAKREEVRAELWSTFDFLQKCDFDSKSRVWNKADLLTVIVETHRALNQDNLELDPSITEKRLSNFFEKVKVAIDGGRSDRRTSRYTRAARAASADRNNRITRGEVIRELLLSD